MWQIWNWLSILYYTKFYREWNKHINKHITEMHRAWIYKDIKVFWSFLRWMMIKYYKVYKDIKEDTVNMTLGFHESNQIVYSVMLITLYLCVYFVLQAFLYSRHCTKKLPIQWALHYMLILLQRCSVNSNSIFICLCFL